jgi:hypothetical protein
VSITAASSDGTKPRRNKLEASVAVAGGKSAPLKPTSDEPQPQRYPTTQLQKKLSIHSPRAFKKPKPYKPSEPAHPSTLFPAVTKIADTNNTIPEPNYDWLYNPPDNNPESLDSLDGNTNTNLNQAATLDPFPLEPTSYQHLNQSLALSLASA